MIFLVLVPAVSFALFSHTLFHTASMIQFDRTIHTFFESWSTPSTLSFFRWITYWGEWRFLFPFLLAFSVLLLFCRRWKAAILLFISCTIGMRLNAALKVFFGRERPEPFDPSLLPPSLAYPSGHAFGALVFYFLLFYAVGALWPGNPLRKAGWWIVSLWIFLIGLSRVGLGVHWASDVVGGYLAGAFWISLTLWIGRKGKVWHATR